MTTFDVINLQIEEEQRMYENIKYKVIQLSESCFEYLDHYNGSCSTWIYNNIDPKNYSVSSRSIGLYIYNTIIDFKNKEDAMKFKLTWCGREINEI